MLIGLVILFAFGLILTPKVKRFFEIDSCLDSGGRWNYEMNYCESTDTNKLHTDTINSNKE